MKGQWVHHTVQLINLDVSPKQRQGQGQGYRTNNLSLCLTPWHHHFITGGVISDTSNWVFWTVTER